MKNAFSRHHRHRSKLTRRRGNESVGTLSVAIFLTVFARICLTALVGLMKWFGLLIWLNKLRFVWERTVNPFVTFVFFDVDDDVILLFLLRTSKCIFLPVFPETNAKLNRTKDFFFSLTQCHSRKCFGRWPLTWWMMACVWVLFDRARSLAFSVSLEPLTMALRRSHHFPCAHFSAVPSHCACSPNRVPWCQ